MKKGMGIILICMVLLLCNGCSQTGKQRNAEQQFLQDLKREEADLAGLFDTGDPESKTWLDQIQGIGESWETCSDRYSGSDPVIISLAENFENTGSQIIELTVLLERQQTGEAIEKLKELKDTAEKNGENLNEIYKNYN